MLKVLNKSYGISEKVNESHKKIGNANKTAIKYIGNKENFKNCKDK